MWWSVKKVFEGFFLWDGRNAGIPVLYLEIDCIAVFDRPGVPCHRRPSLLNIYYRHRLLSTFATAPLRFEENFGGSRQERVLLLLE